MVDEEPSELCSCSPASRPLGAGLSLSLFDDGRQKPTAVNDCQYQDELLARDIAVNDPVVAYLAPFGTGSRRARGQHRHFLGNLGGVQRHS